MCRRFVLMSLLLIVGIFILPTKSGATHLMGGELSYEYDGSITGGAFYNVKLIVYRYCDTSVTQTAPLDPSMFLGIYNIDPTIPTNPLVWFSTETLTLVSSEFVVSAPPNSNCTFASTACIERGEYLASVLLPDNPEGYHLVVERCCRNGNIINLDNPGNAGMSFYTFIPGGIVNSSPQITDISVPYMCIGDTVSLINNAVDPDGDSLVYSFVTPFNGYSGPSVPMPDPFIDNNPYVTPIPDIVYASGYSPTNFLGAGSYAYIDQFTGLTKYYFPNQGFYVVAMEIKEFRNGIQISSMRRDLQFIAIVCSPNLIPSFTASGAGTIFNVGEGQSLCFNVSFSDPDGDSLQLLATGPVLNSAIVNPPGVIPNAIGDSVVTSTFCWTPSCGNSRPGPYQFSVTATDNGCPPKTTSVIYSIYVNAGPASLTATVAISQTPPGIICQGSQTSFLATSNLPGTAPLYYWKINGVPSGNNTNTLTSSNLNNGDIITVMLISNATCLLNDTALSPPYVVAINSQPAPQVTVTSNPVTNLCPQQICLFTANVVNGGLNPTYQWNINGTASGTNNPQFTAANPSGLMSVYVTVSPSTGCPPQPSNVIVFNILPYLQPEISLVASMLDSICPGQAVQFAVSSGLTGASPVYYWTLNGVNINLSDSIITLNNITEGDIINASVTSSYPCLSPTFTYADPLVYHIYDSLTANLTDGPLELCAGQSVNLNLLASGGNFSSYNYNWSYGNSNSGSTSFVPPVTNYYYGSVTDQCYGTLTDSIYIDVLPVPHADFYWRPEHPSTFDLNVSFTDISIDAITWQWNLGDATYSLLQNPEHTYLAGGLYNIQLIATNDVGCTDTLSKDLEIENFITAYIPNSFTPNGDGKNDFFGLTGFSTGGYTMIIFNRWGQLVFSSAGPFDLWNGKTNRGNNAPEGVYTYIIKVNNDRLKKPLTGNITLIR